ncbi:MAG: hypothetical protein A2846_00700 [Candidatus Doudnabacteria bacterium RIFCSPHIGHO2_01_FULL_49_9]|uniref:Uncharacterized protein n=1 Tax=Candidatus Doudnabacteria bacterium RIFCSPHIGHO2_01_FULL_49_9 TaxID=1817827 RepID=A0A1F5NYV9_9BACT|nr:MAG: hypothetical protein A2846_00700 [Candidatus Doudnabacteria bacterium RIFCSPHIGHO2_01_FULL_49_9]
MDSIKHKGLIIVVIGVLVLLAIVIFFNPTAPGGDSDDDMNAGDEIAPQETARYTNEDPQKVIAAFPDGFPAEFDQVKTGQQYIPANSTNRLSTITYESKKTVAENRKIFKDYLAADGYAIMNNQETAAETFYYAMKGNSVFTISIIERDGAVNVSASYSPDLSN